MNAIIDRILIFNYSDEARQVIFKPGLNIITGESKTGKSAIIEIIDYCLFSSRSTIPKGKIDDFGKLFAIVLKIADKYIAIGRPNYRTGHGKTIYLRVESNNKFLIDLKKEYFTKTQVKDLKEAQEEVERHLGLAVLDTRTDNEEDKRTAGKVTLRSMITLLFQHQNLIANKHTLFYRFDDFIKRKKTIADFPILIGWESNEYFLVNRELEQKRKELKIEEKLIERLKINDTELEKSIERAIKMYYSFIGLQLEDDLSLNELIQIYKNLPDPTIDSFSNIYIIKEIDSLNSQRTQLQEELSETENMLRELTNNNKLSSDYSKHLKLVETIAISEEIPLENTKCPICNSEVHEVTNSINSVKESKIRLKEELLKMGTYYQDNTEQIEKAQKERDQLKNEISKLSKDIQKLEEQNDNYLHNKSLIKQAYTFKGSTEESIKQLLAQNEKNRDSVDMNKLKADIQKLKEKLDGFDIRSKIKDAESYLSTRMTEICNKLDFEEELKPGKLQFSLSDFSFYYHFNDEDKILLSEMGSGSNWLACHLSLFVALLHLNCKQKKSSIPSFLIIDQPSQVYFPKDYKQIDENERSLEDNIVQVKNIFTVLKNEIDIIAKDCGFLPQIIVMDHADEPEFEPFVIKRWKKNGNKLI